MALKGDLASVDLAQVFQMLALNQKVGLLYIHSPTAWRALYFDDRGVTLYFNEHTMLDRVLAKLSRSGQLADEGVAEAREHAARQGQRVVDSLLAGAYLSEEDLDAGLRTEIEEDIYDLFFWYDATFEFFEGATEYEGKEGVIHDRFFFGTDMLIMEAARRIDEWSYIQAKVPNNLEIHRPVNAAARAIELEDDQAFQVFELIDGYRNVDRLLETTGISSFHLSKSLCLLIDEELIEPVPAEDFVDAGRDCMNEGRMQDAINLFERAVAAEVGLPDVHSLASEAYDAIGEYELSTFHTKCLAESHAENGKLREAIEMFRWVLESIPTDLASCQRVVELSVGHPELTTQDFDPLKVGKELVDLYLEIDEVERVRSLLEELLRQNPADLELKKSLINVHSKVGDTKRVVELYESIADDLTQQGNPIQAIKYLQKILQLNRSRTDISEWIKRLYRVDERRRSRRRSMVALGMVFCLLVVASVGYYFYNETARKYYDTLDLTPLLENRDFAGATRVIETFLKNYPFTMVAREARKELVALKARESSNNAEQDRKQKAEETRLDGIRYEYKDTHNQALVQVEREDLDQALRLLGKVRTLVDKAGNAQARRWAVAHKIDESYRDLKGLLSRASVLKRKARNAMDEGRWRQGRAHVLELIEKYQMSSDAKLARVPVMIVTKPPGAQIYHDGKALMRDVNNQVEPIATPAVVFCVNKPEVEFQIRRVGFEPLDITIKPRKTDVGSFILNAYPGATYKFDQPVQTPPGVSPGGSVVVGLRGGYLGISGGGSKPVVTKLPGLSEVNGTPRVTRTQIYFATNDNELVAYNIRNVQRAWSYKIGIPLVFDPVVANSRVYLVDRSGNLICLSARNGNRLWRAKTAGRAAGEPVVFGRFVGIGGGSTLLVCDSSNKGRPVSKLEVPNGVSTRVLLNSKFLVFGTGDGTLRGHRHGVREPAWVLNVGRAVREGELCQSEDGESVYVVAADMMLLRVNVFDGRVMRKRKMESPVRPGLAAVNGGLFVVVRASQKVQRGKTRLWDVLKSLDPASLELGWKFSDGQRFLSRLKVGGRQVFFTGGKGEVLRFQ